MKTFLARRWPLSSLPRLCIARNTSGFVVKTGNVGLVINHYTGRLDSHVRHAGFNAQPPFSGNELIEVPTYERTYTMVKDSGEGAHAEDDSVLVNTLSSNTLNVDTSITYHIAWDPGSPGAHSGALRQVSQPV